MVVELFIIITFQIIMVRPSFLPKWSCGFRFEPSVCENPRMSFKTPYYNLGQPLVKRFRENEPIEEECMFDFEDVPVEVTKSLFYNVTFVMVPDYNTKHHDLIPDVPSSGVKAQFAPNVVLAELGMDSFIAFDFPSSFVNDLHPSIRTIPSLNESFVMQHSPLLVATPEVNANRLNRIMNRTGVLGKDTEYVRWIMWAMGLTRTVEEIKNERMRVVGNVHHSHKQFYSAGATPTTADIPQEQVRDTDSLRLSDLNKRNLILVDRDAFYLDIQSITYEVKKRVPDVEFRVLDGMTVDQVRNAYAEAKITIDSFMKGGEAINFESVKWFCVPIVTNQMVRRTFDYLIISLPFLSSSSPS